MDSTRMRYSTASTYSQVPHFNTPEFYGNAVLLKYEYPMMILTKTKSIFLKRLKRMKKYLAEEGSSDESNS